MRTKLKSGDIFPPDDRKGFEDREWNADNNYPYQDELGEPLYRKRRNQN